MSNIEKSEIWVDVNSSKISFARDYPKTLSCNYVGSPVVQLAPTDNDIFCKSVLSDGSIDDRIFEVNYLEKDYGGVNMKLAITEYMEINSHISCLGRY